MAAYGPSWLAYDMRLMMAGIQKFGMHGADGAADRVQAILGRPLRVYTRKSELHRFLEALDRVLGLQGRQA